MASQQQLEFNTLDVFTTEPFTGNQLGLVHVPSSINLIQQQKQTIAIEFNYSETVILHERKDAQQATYDAQIFTPKSELPFAGHPTIGTAVWIFENLETDRNDITIRLKAGDVQAKYDRAQGIATAEIPHNVRIHNTTIPWERVISSQPGLKNASGSLKESRSPIASIVTGVNFVLVDLSSQKDLLNNVIVTKDDIPQASDLDEGSDAGLLGNVFYYIHPDRGDGVTGIQQRVMVIDLEDPATGAASGALTAYLALQKGGKSGVHEFEIDQGVEMGRASKIFAQVTLNEEGNAVKKLELSGQAVEVMKGTLRIK